MTEYIEIESEETMRYENSFGVVPNSTKTTTMVTRFQINEERQRGSYEWYDKDGDRYYCEGGLWFDENMILTDFDGNFDLPPDLIKYLYDNGHLDEWYVNMWVKDGRLVIGEEE